MKKTLIAAAALFVLVAGGVIFGTVITVAEKRTNAFGMTYLV